MILGGRCISSFWLEKGDGRSIKIGGVWKLVLDFTRPGLYGHELFLDMDIFRDGPKLIVSQYIGDPDEVKVLEFTKKKCTGERSRTRNATTVPSPLYICQR